VRRRCRPARRPRLDPRRVPLATIRAEVVPSPPVDLALARWADGPLARLLLRFRFRVMCCAYGIAAWFSTNAVAVSLLESELAVA
jgi:hypothetical protein